MYIHMKGQYHMYMYGQYHIIGHIQKNGQAMNGLTALVASWSALASTGAASGADAAARGERWAMSPSVASVRHFASGPKRSPLACTSWRLSCRWEWCAPMGGRARRPREGACEGSAAEGGCWPAHGGGGRTHGQREEAHEEEDGDDALGEHAGWWSESRA